MPLTGRRCRESTRLTIEGGWIAYFDAIGDVSAEAAIATTTPQDGRPTGLKIDGTGTVRGDPLTLALEVGSPTLVTNGGSPLPIKGELTLATSRLTIDGRLREPAALNGLALDMNLQATTRAGCWRWQVKLRSIHCHRWPSPAA